MPEPPPENDGKSDRSSLLFRRCCGFDTAFRPNVFDEEPPSVKGRRLSLKAGMVKAPAFDGGGFGALPSFFGGRGGHIYVWLDNCCFGNSDKKGFYYVRYQLSMYAGGTTAYEHPVLIVQKDKLRPDQVEYMERKCRETLEAAKREQERRED